jgi:hypothetical protein
MCPVPRCRAYEHFRSLRETGWHCRMLEACNLGQADRSGIAYLISAVADREQRTQTKKSPYEYLDPEPQIVSLL